MTATYSSSDAPTSATGSRTCTVLHVMPDLRIGGGQTIVLQGIRHLEPEAVRTVVAYLDPDGDDMARAFEAAGAVVVCVEHRPGRPWRAVIGLRRLMRAERVDVVQTHSDLDRKIGQIAALLARVPVVGHLHAEWMHLGSMAQHGDSSVRRAAGRAKALVRDAVERRTVVQYIAESVRVQKLFAPRVSAPISVLQQALPHESYRAAVASGARSAVRAELSIPTSAPVVTYVSRLVPNKGLADLLGMVRRLRSEQEDLRLVLVGDGPLRSELAEHAVAEGVEDRVVFAGNRDDVARVLVASDVFVFPSYSEGFGMVGLEAMAAGLPVVAYDLPPFHEFMEPGVTALLCPVGDIDALTAAVADLVRDPARRAAMGAAAARIAEERFPSDGVAVVFADVYGTVVRSSKEGS